MNKLIKISKLLSYVLRHKPDAIGVQLDAQGWVSIDVLLSAAKVHGHDLSRALLDEVVFSNDKQRFAFSADGLSVRANQGHSIDIDLALRAIEPPAQLYHGTASRFIESIKNDGLLKMNRQHVHLSVLTETAVTVGQRHGQPVILCINAGDMHQQGHRFFLAKNGVWLTDHVPVKFIQFSR